MIKNLRYLCTFLLLWVAGVGLAQDVVEISTVDQLKTFRDAVNSGNTYAGTTVKLTADLDLSGESNWTPIGNLVAYPTQSFNGTFDGDGHSISNVTVNDNTPKHAVAGLFGSVVNGTIKNLTVKNVNLTSTHYAGGIVAYTSNGPTIENCKVIGGTIKSTPEIVDGSYDNGDKIGGIMGYATAGSTINNCWVEGVTLSAYRDLGGIAGFSAGTVSNNTVKNVTLSQDLTNGYKNPTPTTIGDIIGRNEGATLSNNTVIKSDPVAQIGETKYETLQAAFDAAQDGDVVELLKDYDATREHPFTAPNGNKARNLGILKGITFDGANHTLTVTGNGIWVGGGSSIADVTIKNITINNAQAAGRCVDTRGSLNSLTLDNANLSTTGTGAMQPLTIGGNQSNTTTVSITNSSITTSEDGKYGYAITTFNPVNMTVDGSTLKGWACFNIKAADGSAGSNGSVFNITNSELTSKNVYSGESNAYSVFKIEDADVTVNVTNTTINVDGANNSEAIAGFQPGNTNGSIVNLGEGNNVVFTGTTSFAHNANDVSKLLISGGVFNQPVPEQNCAGGYIPTDLGDGKYSVKVGSYVAQIGNSKYETLEAAFTAAADGSTVTLLTSVELADRLFVNAGGTPEYNGTDKRFATTTENKSITLDLNGNNVTTSSNIALAGGSLNIVNNGTADEDHGVISTSGSGLAPIEIRGTGDLAQKRTLTIGENVTLKGVDYGLNVFGSNNEQKNDIEVNVNGNVEGTLFVLGNLSNAENDIVVNVNGSVTKATAAGISLNGFATVNVAENATVEGAKLGIEVRAGNLNVAGGTITSKAEEYTVNSNGSGSAATGAAISVAQHTTGLPINASVKGCTLTGVKSISVADPEKKNLEGVTVMVADALANADNVVIPEGYKWVSDGTMSTLTEMPDVAQIGDVKYKTLEAAFTAAADGSTVTLLTSVELADRLFVNAGGTPEYNGTDKRFATTTENKSITLDLNGNNVTTSSNIALAGGSLNIVNNGTADEDHGVISTSGSGLAPIEIRGTGDLAQKRTLTIGENVTLKGVDYGLNVFGSNNEQKNDIEVNVNGNVEGTLFVLGNLSNAENDIVVNVNGSVTKATAAGISLNGFATVNVAENATVEGAKLGIEVRAGNLNVAGGTITSKAEEYTVNSNGSGSAATGAAISVAQHTTGLPINASVKGCTLTGVKSISVADPEKKNLEGVTVMVADALANADNVVIPEGYKWVSDGTMSTLTEMPDVAQIGDVKYKTLADAVEAVPAGTETTIVMIDNETIVGDAGVTIPSDKNVVLDLNGKTVKGIVRNPTSAQTILNKGTLTITDNSDEKNGTITNEVSDENAGSPGNGKNWFSNVITNNGTLTVNAGNISNTGTGGACYAIDNITNGTLCTPVLNIAGGNISAKKVAVRMFCNSTTNDNTVNVTGGNITSENAYAIQTQMANNSANKATLNISGGTLSGQYAWTDYGNKDVATQFDNAHYNITGGFFSGYLWSYATKYCGMDGFISGGLFSTAVGGDLVKPGSACVDNTDEATKANYPYTIGLADVHYYWLDNSGNIDGGGYYTIYAPFAGPDPVLMDGEFVELQKNVTLTQDIEYLEECSFGDPIFKGGTFTLTFGEYDIDLNGHVFPIPTGVTVLTDKQTGIFSALEEGYGVVETAIENGYSYTVAPFVAKIGETKYVSLADAIAAVPADGAETTITMIANDAVEAGVTIAAGQNIVLELNGKTISGNTDSSKTYALITNKGTLVIQDNTDTNKDGTGTGLITTYISNPDEGDVPGYASNTITNNGFLTVKSGKIVNNGSGYACYAIDNQTNGNLYNPILIIDGGRMQQMNEYTYAVRMFANSTTNVNKCEVNGGVIEGGYGLWLQTPNAKANKADLKITGGIINANDGAALYIGGTKADNSNISIDIAGGQINGTGVIIQGPLSGTYGSVSISDGEIIKVQCGANVEHFISGGIFQEEINEAYIAEGYIPTANTDPETMDAYPYTVKSGAYVAAIGTTKYETLQEAVAAVQGGTITMLKDVTLTENIECTSSFTLTFGNYTITKGNYSVAINAGVTITTDKQTDIFTSTAGRVVETAGENSYIYSVEVGVYDEVELIDGVPYPEQYRNGAKAKKVTYSRTFTKAVWSPWWVPFDYTITDSDLDYFTFYSIHLIAGSKEEGGNVPENTSDIWIYLTKLSSGHTLKADHIYVVRPKEENTDYTFTTVSQDQNVYSVNLLPQEPTEVKKKNLETSEYQYEFFGTYVGYTTTKYHDIMYLTSRDGIAYNSNANVPLGSYRWYVRATAKNPDNPDAKPSIGVQEGDGDTDGISNAKVIYDEIEGIYTLGGMKVEHPVKGVNIIKYTDGRTKKINVK